MPLPMDLAGQVYGQMTVIELAGRTPVRWLCRCDCGREKVVRACNLRAGDTTTCGCSWGKKKVTHGHTRGGQRSRTYQCWGSMLTRCRNSKARAYQNYGGRGISVCPRWLTFENFLADMGECPPGMTIERRDNDGGYEPENCYWTPKGAQAQNTRASHHITIAGETRCLAEWLRVFGISKRAFYQRVKKGWTEEQALRTPKRQHEPASC